MNIPATKDDIAAKHPLVLLAKEKYKSTSLEAEVIAFGIYRIILSLGFAVIFFY